MKNSRNQENGQSKQGMTNKPIPEVRDNLDSRERKDASYKERSNKQGRKPNSRDKDKHGA